MNKKNYAFAAHESVQAMIHSLFRFQTLEQAQMITNKFAEEFTLAPKMSDPLDKKSFVLWVHSLELTEKEKQEGFLGNFGRITMHQIPSGKWTLTLTKLNVPLRKHPMRKPVARRHPNMGHPVMRAALRTKKFTTMQEAGEQLMNLHEEFPEISVPGLNKLKIMTYVKATKGQSPVQRLELQVIKRDEGEYVIEIRQNLKKIDKKGFTAPPAPVEAAKPSEPASVQLAVSNATATPAAPDKAAPSDKPALSGHFTKLVSKSRKKKK